MKYVGQFFYVVVVCLVGQAAQAQQVSIDARSLNARLEQIERRVMAVENTRFTAGSGTGAPAGAVADMELRVQDLEEENAALNGAIERLSKVVVDLATKMEKYQQDQELRLQDIEQAAKVAPVAHAPVATAGEAVKTGTVSGSAIGVSGTSGTVAAPKYPAIPAGMGAQEMYSRAYGYLTATDYPNAELWMAEFVKRYPADKLSENGYYWLGEIRLVRNNPQQAAVAFRDGLKAFPKGSKAAGSMLKLGVALQQLKKPDLAKGMWEKVVKDYPNSTEAKKATEMLASLPKA